MILSLNAVLWIGNVSMPTRIPDPTFHFDADPDPCQDPTHELDKVNH
jgi:hypothetical protein